MVIVSDSSPIIALARASKLQLLKDLFTKVFIPDGVYEELALKGKGKAGAAEVERGLFFKRAKVKNQNAVLRLLGPLTRADAEVIVLAKEKKANAILTDDRKLLSQARLEKISVINFLDILLQAKERGFLVRVKEVMDEMRHQGIGIPDDIYEDTLRQAGEK